MRRGGSSPHADHKAADALGAAPVALGGVVADVPALFGSYRPAVRDAAPEDRATLVDVVSARFATPYDVLLHAVEAWAAG